LDYGSLELAMVFFINIPIGIVSLLLTSRLLSDPPEFTREVSRRAGPDG